MPLQAPAADFADLPLHIRRVSVTALKRIGRRPSGEPYFGRHGACRFDDPLKNFGCCYCGLHLDTALAETILHDELPDKGLFKVHQQEWAARFLVSFLAGAEAGMLELADLTGAPLKRLGGNNSLSAEYPYERTQQWAAAVHAHPARVDGFIYVSRQLNDKRAIVVFDRASAKFGPPTYTPLDKIPSLALAKRRLGIVTIGDRTAP